MAILKTIDIDIGGDYADLTDVISVEINEAYKQPCARFRLETYDYGSFGLNDYITIDMGFVGSSGEVFQGFIDSISATRRPGVYEVIGRDVLKRAIDHWIVTTDLENPWSRSNISAEDLVQALLAEAGITTYSGDASSFTFGVSSPAEFQIVSAWDAVERICMIIAWRCYAKDGTVYFQNLKPEPSGVASKNLRVGNSGNITNVKYEESTDNLRNKIVVFGKEGIYAEASAVSPYLPADFYKTAIVSSELIDLQSMADQAASYNLTLYNRLTEVASCDLLGLYDVRARDTINIIEPFTGLTGDWFVYSATHRLDQNGYTTQLHLTR
jgi:hypothetical protein